VSVLEALRSWRYGKAQLTAAVRRAQFRSAVKLALTTGACMAAMLLLVVPLLTLEADARGGGGGHFAGFGGHGGGFGGHRGGISFGGRLQVMLAAVQTVRPALDRFYKSLSDEQKARFNAIAPTDDRDAAGKDQRDLAKFCDEKSPGVTDLPIDRIGQAVQSTRAQRDALDELKDASVKAAEGLKVSCPAYQMLTPTGRVEAMEIGCGGQKSKDFECLHLARLLQGNLRSDAGQNAELVTRRQHRCGRLRSGVTRI
jgi:hypothetical protein